MPTNPALIKATLVTLKSFDGHPVSEESLGAHIEIRYGAKLTTTGIREALIAVRDMGYAAMRVDKIEGDLWTITEAGKSR
jgi:hypothetical protein